MVTETVGSSVAETAPTVASAVTVRERERVDVSTLFVLWVE